MGSINVRLSVEQTERFMRSNGAVSNGEAKRRKQGLLTELKAPTDARIHVLEYDAVDRSSPVRTGALIRLTHDSYPDSEFVTEGSQGAPT